MEDNTKLEQEIDRYLEGAMTNEERESFNERLKGDPELVKEMELQRSIIRAVRNERLGKIIEHEERHLHKQGRIRKLVISIGSFAVAASLFGVFYLTYLNSCEKLADRYYVAYTYTPLPSRGGEIASLTNADSIFFNAIVELERGNKKQAITLLENLHHSSYEMVAATDLAIKWYLSLAYLKNGQKSKARILLLEIVKMPNNEFTQKAKNLLNDLKK
jgi:hypothetical protein